MVNIPRIEATDAPGGAQINQVSITTPFVSDQSAGAKARTYQTLGSIFDYADKEYQKRKERLRAAERVVAGVTETANANRKSREILSNAQKIQDDDKAMAYVRDEFEKYRIDTEGKYADDPELAADIFSKVQRAAMVTEDATFNFIEGRKRDRFLAAMDTSIAEAKASVLSAPSETARAMAFQQIDESIASAEALGFLDAQRAGQMKRDARGEIVSSIVRQAVMNEGIGYASAYLEANKEFIKPEMQVQLASTILAEKNRQTNRALSSQLKARNQILKVQKMQITDPGGAAIAKGADPGNPVSVYNESGGKATMPNIAAKNFVNQIRSQEIKSEELVGYLNEYKNTYGDNMFEAHMRDLARNGMDGGDLGMMVAIGNQGLNTPYAAELMDDMAQMAKSPENRKTAISNFKMSSGTTVPKLMQQIGSNAKFKNVTASMRDKGLDERSINSFANSIAHLAISQYNKNGDVDAAIDRSLSWIGGSWLVRDGVTIYVPDANANVNAIDMELDHMIRTLDVDKFQLPGDKNNKKDKERYKESGHIGVRKYPSPLDDKVYLVDKITGAPLKDDKGAPIVRDFDTLQALRADRMRKAINEANKAKDEELTPEMINRFP